MGQQNPVAVMKVEIANAKNEFAKSLPGYITADRFVRTAQTAVTHTRNIEKVTNIKALLSEVSKAAADGLPPPPYGP